MQNVMIEITNITGELLQGQYSQRNDFSAKICDPRTGKEYFNGKYHKNAKDACKEAVEYIFNNNKPFHVVKTMVIKREVHFDYL